MNNMEHNGYQNQDICFLARIVLEAETPLKIGSGHGNVMTDSAIVRDVNNLPFIPATTLQGILRHALADKTMAERMMGWQEGGNGRGSFLTISEAKLVNEKGKPMDGLQDRAETEKDEFLRYFTMMPIRQHVRISHKGTAENQGKFDEEVVVRGTRFCFDVQLEADAANGENDFLKFLSHLKDKTFRIGGGSRKGFGKVKVVQVYYCKLDFNNPDDFKAYMNKPACLAEPWDRYKPLAITADVEQAVTHYELRLHPLDFILFSSGLGDENSDMAIVHEPIIEWTEGQGHWLDEKSTLVIPASSVKGAIAHRTAFHYNRLCGAFADDNTEQAKTGNDNPAVRSLFGYAGSGDGKDKQRGRVLFTDIVAKRIAEDEPKILNHVKIDRFTGGTINGALFCEEPLFADKEEVKLCMDVIGNSDDENVIKAFECALSDICHGLLPLGGGVNRGNGRFQGTMIRNGKEYDA